MRKKDTISLTNVDIKEDDIMQLDPEVLNVLLVDHTRSRVLRQQTGNPDARANIFWCTSDYKFLGEGYGFYDEICPNLITGDNQLVVQPRVLKSKAQQEARIKDKAEVFTPSWVCNAQNNLIDEAWFGRKDVFNKEILHEDGTHDWIPTEGPIQFSEEKGKTWRAYVRDTRMEITCGEAPYLCSRYDTTTGELIPLERRIGLLDRKLRVISENTTTSKEFLKMAQVAYKNTYGYEWQGDSLLIARESLLWTFIEYYHTKFGERPNLRSIRYIAYIISWNLWQMDGLKMVIPNSCDNVYETNLFGETTKRTCPACEKGEFHGHIGIPCIIRNWRKPKEQQKIQFSSLITNI